MRIFAAIYLLLQSLAATAWWLMLWLRPSTRAAFNAPDAPDSVLLAFWLPDALLFILAGLLAAIALWQRHRAAYGLLLWHAGSACYAALYTLALWRLEPRAWPGALAMAPCLAILPFLLWHLRPRKDEA